ncbi:hypothetical protein FA95DRAFT_1574803 [Auriscalpium vulgare]|uniref:Uncharacterized protein n=1 Tax=Auriscalpium vulgare TaxID=40419 RepID=A0ACB8RI40_9AGAM|nr:hypothetical protein FA95DRAFT_1574803 [Auriscalpium vulgare]
MASQSERAAAVDEPSSTFQRSALSPVAAALQGNLGAAHLEPDNLNPGNLLLQIPERVAFYPTFSQADDVHVLTVDVTFQPYLPMGEGCSGALLALSTETAVTRLPRMARVMVRRDPDHHPRRVQFAGVYALIRRPHVLSYAEYLELPSQVQAHFQSSMDFICEHPDFCTRAVAATGRLVQYPAVKVYLMCPLWMMRSRWSTLP